MCLNTFSLILDHAVEVAHGSTTSHSSEVTLSRGGHTYTHCQAEHLPYTHCQAEHHTNRFDVGKGIVIFCWSDQW